MTYHDKALKLIKLACQDLINRSNEIIPNVEGMYKTTITLIIPIETNTTEIVAEAPTIKVEYESYSSRDVIKEIYNIGEA